MVTVILGMLLVAVIGASIPLYTAAIAQVGMIQRLHQQPIDDVSIYLQTSQSAAQAGNLDEAWTTHSAELNRRVGAVFTGELAGWIEQLHTIAETTPMQLVKDGEDQPARLKVAYYEGWQDTFQLVEGTWPQATGEPGAALDVAIGLEAAERLALGVGDELVLEQRGWESSVPLSVRIAAVVRAADPLNPPADVQYGLRLASSRNAAIEANVFATRAGFLQAATQHVPDAGNSLGWWLALDHESLAFADAERAIAAIDDFQQSLPDEPKFLFRTELAAVLDSYRGEVDLLGAPFGLLLIQIGALALFFLMVTAALVRRAERREIAMFQSRGGANWQIALLDSFQMLLIGAIAVCVAPFVAREILALIIPFLTAIERLPLALDARVFAYAGAAVVVSVMVLAVSLVPILKLPLISAGGAAARSEHRSWWQRYYLDMALLVVGIAAAWRLVSQGTPLIQTQIGGLKADPLLLLAPVFLAAAVGSLVLRLFPTLSGFAARAAARWGRLEDALALWQVSREPAHYGRLSFLLALAIAVGWLATSFHATLARSQYDRAAYQVGADIRMHERDTRLRMDRARMPDEYCNLPGVEAATRTARFFLANASTDPQQRIPGEILAIEPDTFAQASFWREDFGPFQAPPAYDDFRDPGRVLPFVPARIGIWLRIDQPALDREGMPLVSEAGEQLFAPKTEHIRTLVDFNVRLRDASDMVLYVPLEPQAAQADEDGWLYFEGDLSALPYTLEGDVRLDMLYWRNAWDWLRSVGRDYRLYLSDLTLIDDTQAATTLDWLVTEDGWAFVQAVDNQLSARMETRRDAVRVAGTHVMSVTWTQPNNYADAALVLDYPDLGPVPAIASEELGTINRLLPGTPFQVGMLAGSAPWFELRDTVTYYPTLYPASKLFLVTDQRSLLYSLNRRPGVALQPSEVWLRLSPGQAAAPVLEALAAQTDPGIVLSAQTIDAVRSDLDADMLQSGLIGLLYLAFAVAMTLSVISLVSYVALTVRQRRTNFGVLQAIGLSLRRLVTSIVMEQVVVMLVGVALGVLLGAVMSDRVLPALAFSTSGATITPPFVIRVEMAALARYSAILLVVLAVTFGLSLLLIRRLSLIEMLRFGEE